MPNTTPEIIPTEATDGFWLLHVPPPASLNGVDEPTHIKLLPVGVAGSGFTVTGIVVSNPVGSV